MLAVDFTLDRIEWIVGRNVDFEPNDTLESAIGLGVLSRLISGGSNNVTASGQVALLDFVNGNDPADVYRVVTTTGLQEVFFSLNSVASFDYSAINDGGVNGVTGQLFFSGEGAFGGNSAGYQVAIGLDAGDNSDQFYTLLADIDNLRSEVQVVYSTKQAEGIEDPSLLGDASRLTDLLEQVRSLLETDDVNVDPFQLHREIDVVRDGYSAGSEYVNEVRALMDRASDLALAWSRPVYSLLDVGGPEPWRDVSWIEFHETVVWSVTAPNTEAFVTIMGSQSLFGDGGLIPSQTFVPVGYGFEVSLKREVDTGGGPIDPNPPTGPEPTPEVPEGSITGNSTAETLPGTDGDDRLFGFAGNDTIRAGAGDDRLHGGSGADVLDGGSGFDMVDYSGGGAVHVDLRYPTRDVGGGFGRDTLINIEGIRGGSGDDRLVGDSQNNNLDGREGNDVIKGKGGNDVLSGREGDDKIRAGDGDDGLWGDEGNDILIALGGFDQLEGGEGDDFLYGGRGNDYLLAGEGDDVLRGNLNDDTLYANAGNDDIRGGGGNDFISAGRDNDYLLGGNGEDILYGDAGNDTLVGGFGSGRNDGLMDVFEYSTSDIEAGGFDRIRDFEDGIDLIELRLNGFSNFATEVAPKLAQSGAHVRMDFGGGNVLLIENTDLSALTADDFLLL